MKYLEHNKIVLIGASTGGPAHIEKILCALSEPLSFSIIVAQHMGAEFLPSFVQRLSLKTKHPISLTHDDQILEHGKVYIATQQCELKLKRDNIYFELKSSPTARFNPEINYLFASVAPLAHEYKILPIILTGIGDDGVDGCSLLAKEGVSCIAESEKTAIVYGMPARAKERVGRVQVLNLPEIIQKIQEFGVN